jgi:hypothetical protein
MLGAFYLFMNIIRIKATAAKRERRSVCRLCSELTAREYRFLCCRRIGAPLPHIAVTSIQEIERLREWEGREPLSLSQLTEEGGRTQKRLY